MLSIGTTLSYSDRMNGNVNFWHVQIASCALIQFLANTNLADILKDADIKSLKYLQKTTCILLLTPQLQT